MRKIEKDDTVYDQEYVLYSEALREIDAMQAQIDRLRRDAERYRWIARKTSAHGICDGWQFSFPTASTFPAIALAMRDPETALGQCIDAALSEESKGMT